jgi:hypothetical protein
MKVYPPICLQHTHRPIPLHRITELPKARSLEVQKPVDGFGVEYQDYMRRVGRFLPRIKW